MRLWGSLLALCMTVSACGTEVVGAAEPVLVLGVTQRSADGLDVTPLVLLDPAPLYQRSRYDEPREGDRLVAVQFRVTNRGPEDQLIGPTGTIHLHGSDGESYADSLLDTSAGPMFDQLRLAQGQTMVGYAAAEVPEDVTVDAVDFEADRETLRWETAGLAVTDAPEPPARKDDRATVHAMGEKAEVTGERDGVEVSLAVTATRVIDPAEPTQELRPGPDRRLVGVEFAVANIGAESYGDVEDDADLRIFAVHNAADEFVRSDVYGASEANGMPLRAGGVDTWTVLFEVPTNFTVDRVSFSPSYGDRVASIWVTN